MLETEENVWSDTSGVEERPAAPTPTAPKTEEQEDQELQVIDDIVNILDPEENKKINFVLAKNNARFQRLVTWYINKETWLEVAPMSGVNKLFKQQKKELESVRASKIEYEMELATGTLTPSQRSFRSDELKLCKVREKMAVRLISKIQIKIKSGNR